ncbi:unnamed protein product [Cuscuta epithymum]|uniref:LIM zinc-binding domain-containing protein n=1 Tax=Cuscuta epithymum TaxID=186058 RepID=A0AAV0CYN4_9ASTE|nr:unnamed protein product [Cuscuta epithymum]
MGWLSKICRGFSHGSKQKTFHGQRLRGYEEGGGWERPRSSTDARSEFDDEQVDLAIALSLAEEEQKEVEKEDPEEEQREEQSEDQNEEMKEDQRENIKQDQKEEDKGKRVIAETNIEEDEQLARALQESIDMESPPRNNGYGSLFSPFALLYPPVYRICAGCNAEIGHGRFLSCMGAVWHPECFQCNACKLPISDYEFSVSENRPFHKSCYKEQHHPKCDVCKNFIPTNAAGLIEYRAHPFWLQKYCPSHENDRTPRCCSCERMEQVDTRYLILDDGRKLCLECLDSAIMDTHECQPLYLEIRDFYEGLNMKVEQQIPLLLVERQALNEALEGEKNGHHHMAETRGLCLSEEQTVSTILKRPRIGGYRITDMFTEPYRLIRRCEVTAILILYGLPRLLTGSILAHEMMHAYLRLKGYPNLSPEVEEGICQVLAHMWLDSEILAGSASNTASTSSSSSSSSTTSPSSSLSSSSSTSSKKGNRSQFEKSVGEFFKHQIESDTSAAYGDGFREGNKAVLKYGLKSTLDHIRLTGNFPC